MNALVLMTVLLGAADEVPAVRVEAARVFVDLLEKGKFEKASKDFDAVMKKAFPPDKLKETWESVIKQAGEFRSMLSTRTERAGKYDIVFVTCNFAKAKLDVRVVFDREGKITGLRISPTQPKYTFKPPSYSRPDAWTEKDVQIGELKLPGTLTLPKGDGPFAAVVLVHGSGPNDRDETIQGNKPFRDLAWGLATKGIAVLRYDKRTRVHPEKAGDKFGLDDEVTEDAVAAARLLRKTDRIDAKKVFVLGHSLGAMTAPRIVEKEPGIAGAVMMAGNARPLEDLLVEQFTYLFSLGGELGAVEKKFLAELKKQVARVKDPELKPETPTKELPLGAPASYWLSLRAYDQKATAKKVKQPLLILQGERDYQVTMTDFAEWKKALADKKNASLKSYPALNHLFMKGEGKLTPAEYEKQGHVDEQVLDDVAAWIRSH